MASELMNDRRDSENECAFLAGPELRSGLLTVAEAIRIPGERVIFAQGSIAKGIYLLVEGSARLSMLDDEGAEISSGSRTVGAGSILGLPGVLCSIRYAFTARAKEPCRIGFIEAGKFNEFLRERTDLCMEVVQMMSRELSAINQSRDRQRTCTKTNCALSGSCHSCN